MRITRNDGLTNLARSLKHSGRVPMRPVMSSAIDFASNLNGAGVRARCLLLCRVSDAGNDVVARVLWRPASEKRQGTKSRSEVHAWCGGFYGELTAAHELEAV